MLLQGIARYPLFYPSYILNMGNWASFHGYVTTLMEGNILKGNKYFSKSIAKVDQMNRMKMTIPYVA